MQPSKPAEGTGWNFTIPAAAAAAATVFSPYPYISGTGMNTTSQPTSTPARSTSYVDESLLAAKLEAVEARTETKFAQLLGELKVIAERIGTLDGKVSPIDGRLTQVEDNARAGKREIIIAIIGSALAVAALGWAGVQIFQGGLGLSAGAFQAGMAAAEKPSAQPS